MPICGNTYSSVLTPKAKDPVDAMYIDPTNAQTATRWILVIFSSEVSFLFRLPVFLIPTLPEEVINDGINFKLQNRQKRFFNNEEDSFFDLVSSDKKRHDALYKKPTHRKYLNMVTVQIVLSLLGLGINIVWWFFWWLAVQKVTPYADRDKHNALKMYTDETLHAITSSRAGHYGTYMMMVSIFLYFLQYIHYRHYLVRLAIHYPNHSQVKLNRRMYILSHISLFNFILDVPDINVPTTKLSAAITRTLVLVAGLIFVFTFMFLEPLTMAYGCYSPLSTYKDIIYGLCPAFFSNNDPQQQITTVCDQKGVMCGSERMLWKTQLAYELHYAKLVLFAAFTLYSILTIETRILFYNTARRFLYDVSENHHHHALREKNKNV